MAKQKAPAFAHSSDVNAPGDVHSTHVYRRYEAATEACRYWEGLSKNRLTAQAHYKVIEAEGVEVHLWVVVVRFK